MAQVVSRRLLTTEARIRVHVGFVMDKVTMGQLSLRVLRFSPISVISQRPSTGLLFVLQAKHCMEIHGAMALTGETEELVEKPVPLSLCPPQIPHGLIRARTRDSAVRGQRLTA
jgi:hypothetical protein